MNNGFFGLLVALIYNTKKIVYKKNSQKIVFYQKFAKHIFSITKLFSRRISKEDLYSQLKITRK